MNENVVVTDISTRFYNLTRPASSCRDTQGGATDIAVSCRDIILKCALGANNRGHLARATGQA